MKFIILTRFNFNGKIFVENLALVIKLNIILNHGRPKFSYLIEIRHNSVITFIYIGPLQPHGGWRWYEIIHFKMWFEKRVVMCRFGHSYNPRANKELCIQDSFRFPLEIFIRCSPGNNSINLKVYPTE